MAEFEDPKCVPYSASVGGFFSGHVWAGAQQQSSPKSDLYERSGVPGFYWIAVPENGLIKSDTLIEISTLILWLLSKLNFIMVK